MTDVWILGTQQDDNADCARTRALCCYSLNRKRWCWHRQEGLCMRKTGVLALVVCVRQLACRCKQTSAEHVIQIAQGCMLAALLGDNLTQLHMSILRQKGSYGST